MLFSVIRLDETGKFNCPGMRGIKFDGRLDGATLQRFEDRSPYELTTIFRFFSIP